MLKTNFFKIFDESEIRKLRGGPKHEFWYFIGVLEKSGGDFFVDVIWAKLRNQMGTQKSPSFPAGYEPFLTRHGERTFCLAEHTIDVARLRLSSSIRNRKSIPFVEYYPRPACILNPRKDTDQFEMLMTMAERFDVETEVRLLAAKTMQHLGAAADFLAPDLCSKNGGRISDNLAERLEVYLGWAETGRLRDLLQVLRVPGPGGQPSLAFVA